MKIESEKFAFTSVEYKYTASRELSPRSLPPIASGINRANVHCKVCGHLWTAHDYGEGRIAPALGAFLIQCPSCDASESVNAALLMNPR